MATTDVLTKGVSNPVFVALLPDPSGAPDGQVIQTLTDAYVLGAVPVPTLADVLASGNLTGGHVIQGASDGSSAGAALGAGDASGDDGGSASVGAGGSGTGNSGASLVASGGSATDGGSASVGAGGSGTGHGGAQLLFAGGGATHGGKAQMFGGPGVSGDTGGTLVLAGGDDSAADTYIQGRNGAAGRSGAIAYVQGGTGDGSSKFGGYFDAMPGTATEHGRVQIGSDNTTGNAGDVITGDPTGTLGSIWQALVTVQAASPVGGGYLTPLVFDSTASTGGLYAWAGTDYALIGLATS